MADLVETIGNSIRSRGLLRRGQKVLVAVSGGVDSMVLLRVLHLLSKQQRWQLTISHLNHRLRGRSSDADQKLVQRTAEQLGLEAVIDSADVRTIMKDQKISLEMAARQARHAFLARTARRLKISTIALAHHADDEVELFFLRLLRGSGSGGLGGMRWRKESPADPSVQIIRPLLGIPKETLRAYARENRLKFREDASNKSLDVLRNRIRHDLVPRLERRYQPGFRKTIPRTIEILRAEFEFVDAAAIRTLEQLHAAQNQKNGRESADSIVFSDLHVALQRRVLHHQLIQFGISPDFNLIETLRTNPEVHLCPPCSNSGAAGTMGHIVWRSTSGLLHLKNIAAPSFASEMLKVELHATSSATFSGLRLHWRIQPTRGTNVCKNTQGIEFFDVQKVGSEVILRHWRPGDRFQPIGMRSVVKIQDFFTNEKVPRAKRHELVLATTRAGEVFWIEGMRISDRFKLTKRTFRRLQWTWERF